VRSIDWGTAAEWAGALLAGAALLLAISTVRSERRWRHQEEDRRHRDEDRQRAAQARRVVIQVRQWADPAGPTDAGGVVGPPWLRRATLTVTNRSDAPIFAVTGTASVMGTGLATADAPVLEPGGEVTGQVDANGVVNTPGDDGPADVRVVFTDSEGVAWVAGGTGKLDELR